MIIISHQIDLGMRRRNRGGDGDVIVIVVVEEVEVGTSLQEDFPKCGGVALHTTG